LGFPRRMGVCEQCLWRHIVAAKRKKKGARTAETRIRCGDGKRKSGCVEGQLSIHSLKEGENRKRGGLPKEGKVRCELSVRGGHARESLGGISYNFEFCNRRTNGHEKKKWGPPPIKPNIGVFRGSVLTNQRSTII